MSLHANKRLWQKHVLAENRRSVEGLLATLCAEPVYVIMATGQEHRGREGVAAFYLGLFESMPDVTFDLQEVFIGESGVFTVAALVLVTIVLSRGHWRMRASPGEELVP